MARRIYGRSRHRKDLILGGISYDDYVISKNPLLYYNGQQASGGVLNTTYARTISPASLLDGTHIAVSQGTLTGNPNFPLTGTYDGAAGYTDITSASFASIFNAPEGTLANTVRVANAGVWADGSARYIVNIEADADNRLFVRKDPAANTLRALYEANTTAEQIVASGVSSTDWLQTVVTWKRPGNFSFYINSALIDSINIAGVWAGSITAALIAAQFIGPTNAWHGDSVPSFILDDREWVQSEITELFSRTGI